MAHEIPVSILYINQSSMIPLCTVLQVVKLRVHTHGTGIVYDLHYDVFWYCTQITTDA